MSMRTGLKGKYPKMNTVRSLYYSNHIHVHKTHISQNYG